MRPVTTRCSRSAEGHVRAAGVFTIQQEFDDKYVLTNIDFVKQQMGFDPDEYSAVEIKLKPGRSGAGETSLQPYWENL